MDFSFKWLGFSQKSDQDKNADILFGGDFCPRRRYEEKIISGIQIFDENLQKLIRQSDFSIVNLEAPLCRKETKSFNPSGYGLRAAPEVAEFIKNSGIDAVGLANNHIRDFGDDGVLQTMKNLDAANILHTGAGRTLSDAEKPLSVCLNGLNVGVWALAEKELNVADKDKPGSSWFRPEMNVSVIKEIKGKFDFLIVFLHAGHEFILTPSPRIRESCRAFIDAGADAVIAHHPHVPQGVEKYKEGFIAYSLGNLVFDSDYVSAYEHTDVGYMLRLNISPHKINKVEIIPYFMDIKEGVRSMNSFELNKFKKTLTGLSDNIKDEQIFYEEWAKNVKMRWDRDYKNIMKNFSNRLNDASDVAFPLWAKNFFACPTSKEIIEKIFDMIKEGSLDRN